MRMVWVWSVGGWRGKFGRLDLIEKKMNISASKFKIPYWLGMLVGYGFDLVSFITQKKFSISSVRVKKFCATTQFNSTKAHSNFKAPYSLKEGVFMSNLDEI